MTQANTFAKKVYTYQQLSSLRQFLADPATPHLAVSWVMAGNIRLYVRKSQRYLFPNNSMLVKCLDIANVVIDAKNKRGEGYFTSLLEWLEANTHRYGIEALYVENVLDLRFSTFFTNRPRWNLSIHSLPNLPCYYYIIQPAMLLHISKYADPEPGLEVEKEKNKTLDTATGTK